MKKVCDEVDKDVLAKKYRRLGYGQFGEDIRVCARTFVELQQKRHDADYDPQLPITLSEAFDAIADVELAIARLEVSPLGERDDFLALLLVGSRE